MRCFFAALSVALSAACAGAADSPPPERNLTHEMIVLAAPAANDLYYADRADEIFAFHVAFARQIEGRDDVVVLTDAKSYARYAKALGPARVFVAPMTDIWMRDFTLSNAAHPTMLRYTAAGQGGGRRGQRNADAVQERFARFAEAAGLAFAESDLLNDGGNFVDDYAGNVVVSRKFLRDNRFDEAQGRAALQRLPGVSNVAFIDSDEQGGLEHADGVVAFVDVNTLIVNSYPDDPAFARKLRADLERGLPGVVIHEMVTPYKSDRIYDERFGSACGLYTNALVTPQTVYLPQFGIPEDEIALRQARAATRREVVPVQSGNVCHMGGGVRCLSLQLRDANATALRAHIRSANRQ
jgi:agmatine/peptidylarginine deiminase